MGIFVEPLLVDLFAGGGGASSGMEKAFGRPVDIAINHDPDAIDMHMLNHPHTRHYQESVWDVNPRKVTGGLPVAALWASPDGTHFSRAKGGTPVKKEIRGLAWSIVRWAKLCDINQIYMENVPEMENWGPLNKKIIDATDDTGEPIKKVSYFPCKKRRGQTFKNFVKELEKIGYWVKWKILTASDHGAPTSRQRLFLVARKDGIEPVFPKVTHGRPGTGLQKWRTAAECIDWSIPCKSIFERKKSLAENSCKRVAKGIKKFVLDDPNPFILRIGQTGFGGNNLVYPLNKPLTTITSKAEHCLVEPILAEVNDHSEEVAAFLMKYRTGAIGQSLDQPMPTITAGSYIKRPAGAGHALAMVTTHMIKYRGTNIGSSADEPVPTITAGGLHVGKVQAFLMKYYGPNVGHSANSPLHTITTKERFALVTVHGELYQIVDIRMRMLEPEELFLAQGFDSTYRILLRSDGTVRPKYQRVARCGNSVPPVMAEALIMANNQAALEHRKSA